MSANNDELRRTKAVLLWRVLCNQASPRIYEGSDPNGIRTQFRNFVTLRNSATNLRETARYERNRESASLHESRRITQFDCREFVRKSLRPDTRNGITEFTRCEHSNRKIRLTGAPWGFPGHRSRYAVGDSDSGFGLPGISAPPEKRIVLRIEGPQSELRVFGIDENPASAIAGVLTSTPALRFLQTT
jgi:hypothetical protein